ncbi:hypothetical protein AVEN_38729-1 [Araneus ventricosus]|uniref:Uncharacterized protein n=1 Tax=Araneus ventricosus TaxID=182803 RepID=A0A4Y2WX95_ARAVE|nr:hypothetical protein AVEN_38729-1 [Araneus ventricosus]
MLATQTVKQITGNDNTWHFQWRSAHRLLAHCGRNSTVVPNGSTLLSTTTITMTLLAHFWWKTPKTPFTPKAIPVDLISRHPVLSLYSPSPANRDATLNHLSTFKRISIQIEISGKIPHL